MQNATRRSIKVLEGFIFWSRWLQAPLYLGLIVAQGVYVYQFMIELSHLVGKVGSLTDTDVMLIVLGLIDVVMIANLLAAAAVAALSLTSAAVLVVLAVLAVAVDIALFAGSQAFALRRMRNAV